MIKVLLVDDHEMVRMGVSAYLSTQPDIEVVGKLKMEKRIRISTAIKTGYYFNGPCYG